jgi:hypothetical protein
MKALSIWQPWASLILSGEKKIETRSWPVPYSIRGTRIAIAGTKTRRASTGRLCSRRKSKPPLPRKVLRPST